MVPSVSRNCMSTLPRGNTARTTRAVSSGTGGMGVGLSDMDDLLSSKQRTVRSSMLMDVIQHPPTSPPVSVSLLVIKVCLSSLPAAVSKPGQARLVDEPIIIGDGASRVCGLKPARKPGERISHSMQLLYF